MRRMAGLDKIWLKKITKYLKCIWIVFEISNTFWMYLNTNTNTFQFGKLKYKYKYKYLKKSI